jgi:hypothetical protein
MINRLILKKINKWINNKKIIIINGARQVGKTTILKEIMRELESKNKNCAYLNIEAFQIADQLNENPDNIFNFLDKREKINFFLLDEIQLLDDPSHFLKYLYDQYDNIKLIATGSANLEIKAKLQDSLAGRKISFNVQPLSIKEIIDFEKIDIKTGNPLLLEKINKIFEEYLIYGGLPEVFLTKNKERKQELLKEYIGTYVNKDIRSLINDINIAKFNKLNIALAHNIGNLVNKNQLANDIDLDNRTLARYLDLLQYSFIFDFIPPYYSNPLTQIKKMQKVYCFDFGVRNAIINNFNKTSLRDDGGRLFENFIFVNLKNKDTKIYFWRTISGQEADFVYQEEGLNVIKGKFRKFDKAKIDKSIQSAIELLKPNKVQIINLNLNTAVKNGKSSIKYSDWLKIV